jgi:chemotaxis protein MotB
MSRSSRRGIRHDEEDTDRWLVSYADFITLLFAFFVVMYSISSVNLGKYRVLSDSMNTAFSKVAGDPVVLSTQLGISVQRAPISIGIEGQVGLKAMKETAAAIEDSMKKWIKQGQIAVRGNEKWLEVEINSSILFASGRAQLSTEASKVLTEITDVFSNTNNPIYVSGYTDDIPINTLQYPSNWELSAARAASVVRIMAQAGINPARLGAIGFAEFRSINKNDSVENRQKNRRVIIRMLAGEDIFSDVTPFADTKTENTQLDSTLSGEIINEVSNEVPALQVNELQAAEPARGLQ